MSNIYNFSAGPAVLPKAVLEQARDELVDWHGSGMSVMEMSHRGKEFMGIAAQMEADLRELMGIPANYKVLFLQGGQKQKLFQSFFFHFYFRFSFLFYFIYFIFIFFCGLQTYS